MRAINLDQQHGDRLRRTSKLQKYWSHLFAQANNNRRFYICVNFDELTAIHKCVSGGAEIIGTSIGLLLLLKPRFKFCLLGALLLIGGLCCVASWEIEPNGEFYRKYFFYMY
jgi:hypothetical protein